jgi:magnesium-transporting ATPase (P-type)
MQKLRSIHLYLGCVFAPLLLFFAISGIWQTLGLHSHLLERLASIHTSHHLKTRDDLTSSLLMIFVLLMAASFIASTILGVMMALKFGRNKRAVFYCLAAGVVVPLGLVVIAAWTR